MSDDGLMGELILVRHGQTDANAAGLLQGRIDLSLNALGRRQADDVSRSLSGLTAEGAAVITSPLARARETAAALGAPVLIDERWIELDYGDFDGRPLGDVPSEVWVRWRSDASFVPAGGESIASLGRRVRAACDALAATQPESITVVVSHVSPIKAAVAWALGVDDAVTWRMHLDQASITRIRIGGATPALVRFNDVNHLGGNR